MSDPVPLPEKDLQGLLIHPAAVVDVRRDIFLFLKYVRERGLRRTYRNNLLPKADAKRLAKILSFAGEAEVVEETGEGLWSEHVSWLARRMGLVSFDEEGVYVGYSSTSPSYPHNDVKIEKRALNRYLASSPSKKEKAILSAHLQMVESEFFTPALLLPTATFESFGCATGPAGRMDLPAIRRSVLSFLAGLEPGVWYDLESTVAAFGRLHPRLILESDEGTGKWDTGDLYRNFREFPAGESRYSSEVTQITTETPRAFFLVEGRYLENFLRGIPYLLGFVSLAERPPEDPHGLAIDPPRERIRAFRVTERLARVLEGDLDRVRVTVLPTFEILVEAPSYPETVLSDLSPFTVSVSEESPLHHLKLTRNRVVMAVADSPDGIDLVAMLEALSRGPLPPNVARDLAAWSRRGGSLTVYEGFALLETAGAKEKSRALSALGKLVEEPDAGDFSLVRKPKEAFDRLEQAELVPVSVRHLKNRLAPCAGKLGSPPRARGRKKKKSAAKRAPARIDAVLETEDLVGLRSDRPELIEALAAELGGNVCEAADERILLPASALPKLRTALRRLQDRFSVKMGYGPELTPPRP